MEDMVEDVFIYIYDHAVTRPLLTTLTVVGRFLGGEVKDIVYLIYRYDEEVSGFEFKAGVT